MHILPAVVYLPHVLAVQSRSGPKSEIPSSILRRAVTVNYENCIILSIFAQFVMLLMVEHVYADLNARLVHVLIFSRIIFGKKYVLFFYLAE